MPSNNMTEHWKNDQTLGELMKDLLTRALDAHGGLARWREIEAFQLKVSIGGGLWRLKGLPDGLRDVTLRIQAHRPIVTITPFGGEARTGYFTSDRVWIEDANGGVVEERATPRASFAGHILTTPWDKLQELYFVSYALWNYLAIPFVFKVAVVAPPKASGLALPDNCRKDVGERHEY